MHSFDKLRRVYQNCKFYDPWGRLVLRCGHINYMIKIHYLFKSLFLYIEAQFRQIEGIVMMNKEGYRNHKFHDSQCNDSHARAWPFIYRNDDKHGLFS